MTYDGLDEAIDSLQGPILVLGASGFIGANLLRTLLARRSDVFGTTSNPSPWRLEGIPAAHVITGNLLIPANLRKVLDSVRPRTVMNCIAYGAYSFETDVARIYRTNVELTAELVEELRARGCHRYVHAGSSSEYGDNAAGPDEDAVLNSNSHYSASKIASAKILNYAGSKLDFPCVNLRLYSIYGQFEDSSRLVPASILKGLRGEALSYVDPTISRDFVYVDDACAAFVMAAANLRPDSYGRSFNIGSGAPTRIGDYAAVISRLFDIGDAPSFTMPARKWDVTDWFANTARTRRDLGWSARTPLEAGLARTRSWIAERSDLDRYVRQSKQFGLDEKYSVTAIIACYKDGQAIPIMYDRLKATFEALRIGYEIIFVNDGSPDDSEAAIREITSRDPAVIGITHSRNFGSQAAFRSGMEVATKNACVLLDGDLQDPPELIADFVAKWREGYDVVYGRRVNREAPAHMRFAYKAFYRVFESMSYISVPRDAGDFSLIDRRVVQCMLNFPERDAFIRGIRAFVGFRQTGVDYVRPERMFGVSTNNMFKNFGWAKKGILSFSNVPLTFLSLTGIGLFLASLILAGVYLVSRLLFPASAPRGFTSIVMTVILFGSFNLIAISLIGEYISKIFEEVKMRPHFIRRDFIRNGEILTALSGGDHSSSGAVRFERK